MLNGRESAMSPAVNCHHCKKPGHEMRDCKKLARKPETEIPGNSIIIAERSNTHSNEDCYQHMEKSEEVKNDRNIINNIVTITTMVIRTRNMTTRKVTVYVRRVLLFKVKIAKKINLSCRQHSH